MSKVIIIGAGLAGSLLSTYFAKRGIDSDVYEARSDMRREEMSAGRSINLALSNRGIAALKQVGMDQFMLDEAVPMHGRLVHPIAGENKFLPYSGRTGEYINSVSRGGLNIALINQADKYPASTFHFNQRCTGFDCRSGVAQFKDETTGKSYEVTGETIIATDGAGSAVRRAMMNRGVPRFDYSQDFLDHGYKELSIPPASEFKGHRPDTAEGEFLLEKDALHIWARSEFMMIALPNFDGSFTCTLFLAYEGKDSFAAMEDGSWGADGSNPETASAAMHRFFEHYFPDAVPLMPDLEQEFFENPTGDLGTIKCFPWNVGGKALLLGDSAHAIVPFYGQGMNASFEDCRVLDELVEEHGRDWEKVFAAYANQRKVNTDAIADLAVENFYEMRDHVADPVFVKKRELETKLESTYPEYFSKYSLVTFRDDLPYADAKRIGNAQNEILMKMCASVDSVDEINIEDALAAVKAE